MTIEKLNQDFDKLGSGLKSAKRDMFQQAKTLNEIIAHCDQEVARLQKEAPSSRQKHYIEIYKVRRQLAVHNQEMAKIILAFEPESLESLKAFQARLPRLETLRTESKYLALEFSVVNYRPIAQSLQAALAGMAGSPARGSGPLSQAAGPTAPRAGGTGPLSAARSGGTGPLSAARSGGTGPLSAARSGGTGPLSAARSGGTGVPRPPAPAEGAKAPAQATPGTTGRLSAAAAGGGTAPLDANVAKLLTDPAKRQGLEQLLVAYNEIDEAMAALRGPEPGTLAVPPETIELGLNKIAGKVYYLSRHIQQLGPEAAFLAFETEEADDQLSRYMARQLAAPSQEASSGNSLTSKLKSFFNMP